MNAPNRYELFVLEEGEKPCVTAIVKAHVWANQVLVNTA